MDIDKEVREALDEVLGLGGRGLTFASDMHLLGAVPELDSMAVVSLIGVLEERLGISVPDDEIDGSTFRTVGTLVDFVRAQLAS